MKRSLLVFLVLERMGIRPNGGSDRLRTIWTPEMDRYFIDLMLEQVRKGNRIDDHLFSKGAWKLMTSLFIAKFNYRYEKDVLKNRHKTLRNLYRTIRNLLQQKGFSWDEKRKMVTADNKVWDEYTKAHPEARSYRIKTIPYYTDLCEIYADGNLKSEGAMFDQNANIAGDMPVFDTDSLPGGTGFPGTAHNIEDQYRSLFEYSPHSAGNKKETSIQPSNREATAEEAFSDILINEDYRSSVDKGVADDLPQTKSINASTILTRIRTYWQPPMDHYFIDLMLEQVKKGNQIDGLFRKQAWADMIASFNSKFGFNYEVDILKNRYKTLRRQYNVLKNILELDGFVWDEARQMVTADDCVWQDFIKAHVDARQYMTRPVPYYKDLCVIFKELSYEEKDNFAAHNLEVHNGNPDVKFSRPFRGRQSPATSLSSDDQVEITVTDQKKKRSLENPSTSTNSKKARSEDEGMAVAIREMASVVSSLSSKRKEDDSDYLRIENVVEAIQALPDMDEDLVLDACDFLEDEKKAKTFLALDFKLRKKWLMRKLRPQHQFCLIGVDS